MGLKAQPSVARRAFIASTFILTATVHIHSYMFGFVHILRVLHNVHRFVVVISYAVFYEKKNIYKFFLSSFV